MRLLEGHEEAIGWYWVNLAVDEAQRSSCGRDQCGSVIVDTNGRLIGVGFGSPPGDRPDQRRCERRDELGPGFKSDRTCCMHAECRAIMNALRHHPDDFPGATIYFVRLGVDGRPVPSGEPYCTICSKLCLDIGLAEFVLWHSEGLTAYDTVEYNDLSFAYGH